MTPSKPRKQSAPNFRSRRQVLKSAAGLLAAGTATTVACSPATAKGRKKNVIVAGGGIAGLCCAFELMERGHDVTVLEASRRTGGHVKTISEPFPDGLYADVGAEHFTKPGYAQYWEYVKKFDLPALPWKRRQDMYRNINGKWYTEEQLADQKVLAGFGFNPNEINYIVDKGWTELNRLYFDPYTDKFTDEYQPFGVGLDDLDQILLGDLLAKDGASDAALSFCGGSRRSAKKPASRDDSSALFTLWRAAIRRLRGLPEFSKAVFHLKGGNQLLPDTFAEKLGDRVRRNCPVLAVEHSDDSVKVSFTEGGKKEELSADYLVLCFSPSLLQALPFSPGLSESKAYALKNTVMGMYSRVLLQTKTPFWKGDVPSINLATGNSHMSEVYETADEVAGDSALLMGSGLPAQTPEQAIAAFREFYPGKAKDTIEQCVVHEWWKEEPTCFGCERHSFPLGELDKMWPHIIKPEGRIHFAGAAYDNLHWGMDAATRSANRVAEAIHAA